MLLDQWQESGASWLDWRRSPLQGREGETLGESQGRPCEKRVCGVVVFLKFFLVFIGRARGGPVKKRLFGVVVFLVSCAIILIWALLTMFIHMHHIIPANCRRDFSAGGETLGAA